MAKKIKFKRSDFCYGPKSDELQGVYIFSESCKSLQNNINHICERSIQIKATNMCLDEEKRRGCQKT
jgi:hypothetical protein